MAEAEEIIPSGRLRDHGDWHRAGRELSLVMANRDLGAGIGPRSYYYSVILTCSTLYMTCDMLPEMISEIDLQIDMAC